MRIDTHCRLTLDFSGSVGIRFGKKINLSY